MLAWYRQAPLTQIDKWEYILPEAREVALALDVDFHLYCLPNEFNIPAVLALSVSKKKRSPHITVGCAAAMNWSRAVKRAALESIQTEAGSWGFGATQLRNPLTFACLRIMHFCTRTQVTLQRLIFSGKDN